MNIREGKGYLNINNIYFDNIVRQIYPSELQLNKANTCDIEAAFLDLHMSISNDIVSTKIYDKRDDLPFLIFLDDTKIWYVNSKLDLDLSCLRTFGTWILCWLGV